MPAVKPRFREIQESDVDAIADLLTRGFVHRSRQYWIRGLRRQGARSLPPDVPRFGYLMESDRKPVGCLLLIYSTKTIDGTTTICCNNSSWYVDPEFRNYAALFASMAMADSSSIFRNWPPFANSICPSSFSSLITMATPPFGLRKPPSSDRPRWDVTTVPVS